MDIYQVIPFSISNDKVMNWRYAKKQILFIDLSFNRRSQYRVICPPSVNISNYQLKVKSTDQSVNRESKNRQAKIKLNLTIRFTVKGDIKESV